MPPGKMCIENGKYAMVEESTQVTKLNEIWGERRKNKFGLKYAD